MARAPGADHPSSPRTRQRSDGVRGQGSEPNPQMRAQQAVATGSARPRLPPLPTTPALAPGAFRDGRCGSVRRVACAAEPGRVARTGGQQPGGRAAMRGPRTRSCIGCIAGGARRLNPGWTAPLPEPRSRPVDDEPQPSTAPDLATGLHRRHRCHGGPRRQRCGDRPGRRRHPDRRGAAGHRLSSPRLPVRCDRVGVATGGVSSVRVASLVLGSCSRFLRIRALEALTDRRDVERQVLQHFNRARGEHEREDQPSVSLRMCDTRSHRCGSV